MGRSSKSRTWTVPVTAMATGITESEACSRARRAASMAPLNQSFGLCVTCEGEVDRVGCETRKTGPSWLEGPGLHRAAFVAEVPISTLRITGSGDKDRCVGLKDDSRVVGLAWSFGRIVRNVERESGREEMKAGKGSHDKSMGRRR